ncbi:unnamed protein product [Sphacelaria rigidula]
MEEQVRFLTEQLSRMQQRMNNTPVMHAITAQQAPFHTPHAPNSHRIRSNKSILPWDEKAATSTNVRDRFEVFYIQMCAYFKNENCYDALLVENPIRVHSENEDDLRSSFGNEAVDKAKRAMSIILDKVTFPPLVRHIDMLASPSQAWNYIVQYYRIPEASEKAKLEHDW